MQRRPADSTGIATAGPATRSTQPASQARAMGWMAFVYQASGELYYNTTQSALRPRPRTSTHRAGTATAPSSTPGRRTAANGSIAIGGTHDIPIESIRLKRIRDGREDYEYLHVLARQNRAGDAAAFRRAVRVHSLGRQQGHGRPVGALSPRAPASPPPIDPGRRRSRRPRSGPGTVAIRSSACCGSGCRAQPAGCGGKASARWSAARPACRVDLRSEVSTQGGAATRDQLDTDREGLGSARRSPQGVGDGKAEAGRAREAAPLQPARVHVRARLRSRPA